MFTFNNSVVLVKHSRWVFWGEMIKEGIWKILIAFCPFHLFLVGVEMKL